MESGGFQQWTTMTMAHAEGNMAALVKYFKVTHVTFQNGVRHDSCSCHPSCFMSMVLHSSPRQYRLSVASNSFDHPSPMQTFKNKKHKVPICQGVTDPIECLFSKEHLNGTQLATVAEDDLTK